MYLLSILAIILVSFILSLIMPWEFSTFAYMNPLSLLILFLLCLFFLVSAGMLRDFNQAFQVLLKKETKSTLYQLKRSLEAVILVKQVLLYGSVFITAFHLLSILYHLDDPASLGPSLGAAGLNLVYSSAVILLLLPVKSGLNIKIIGFINEDNDGEKEGS